jgi:hypothetical protein
MSQKNYYAYQVRYKHDNAPEDDDPYGGTIEEYEYIGPSFDAVYKRAIEQRPKEMHLITIERRIKVDQVIL